MRTRSIRGGTARAAILTASLALVAACNGKTQPPGAPDPSVQPPAGAAYRTGSLLVSDGSRDVVIDGKAVTFPTAVQDAAWSPDGSRVAFVDGDGVVAVARP